MAQDLKLISDVTITNFNNSAGGTTNLYTYIDEATISDADYIYSNNGSASEYTGDLDIPLPSLLRTGTHTFEVRMAKTNNGSPTAGGTDVDVTIVLQQDVSGTINTIATRSETLTSGNWTTFTYTLTPTEVSNLTSSYFGMRLSIQPSSSGGNPNNRRGAGVSWANWQIPDPPDIGRGEFDGSGDLVVAGQALSVGQAVFDGAADLVVAGESLSVGQATFDGAGDLAAAGAVVVFGQAVVDGAADVVVSGTATAFGQGVVDGVGDVTPVGIATALAQAALDGSGDLVVIGTADAVVQGIAAFDGASDLIAVGLATAFGASQVDGASDLVVTGIGIASGTAGIDGSSDLAVVGIGVGFGVSAWDGAANVDVVGNATAFGQSSFDAAGDLVVVGTSIVIGVSSLEGTSDLVVTGVHVVQGTGSMVGTGTLAVIGNAVAFGVGVIDGSANVVVVGIATANGVLDLAGSGDLVVAASSTQFAYPVSDVTTGGWITTPLYEKVDEPSTPSDADFIESTDATTSELALGTIVSPSDGLVSLFVRARKQTANSANLRVQLVEGTTQKAEWLITSLSTSFATYQLDLTTLERDSVVDWADLRVRLVRE